MDQLRQTALQALVENFQIVARRVVGVTADGCHRDAVTACPHVARQIDHRTCQMRGIEVIDFIIARFLQ